MKRIALILALGFLAAGRVSAAEEKSETKTEHQADTHGSSTDVEKSSKDHGAAHEEKSTVEHKKKADGKVETKKHTKRSDKASAKAKTKKSETKETTVKDPQGNVVEHEKTTK